MAVVAYWMFEAVVRGIIGREVVMGGFVRDHWKGGGGRDQWRGGGGVVVVGWFVRDHWREGGVNKIEEKNRKGVRKRLVEKTRSEDGGGEDEV